MEKKRTLKTWTEKDKELLRELYPITATKDLVAVFGATIKALKRKAWEYGLTKTKETRSRSCREASNTTGRFKPGSTPKNTVPIGSIRTRTRGGMKYYVIKIDEKAWLPLQVFRWNEAGMPAIPADCVLACKTDNILDCHPSNWEIKRRIETLVVDYEKRKYTPKGKGRKKRPLSTTIKKRRALQRKREQDRIKRAQREVKEAAKRKARQERIETEWKAQQERNRRKEKDKFKIKQVDLSAHIPVKIDHKTTIYIKQGQDPEKARLAFLARKTQVA